MKLIFALLVILPLAFHSEGGYIGVPNGGRWGSWGRTVMCPRSYRAFGFSLKVSALLLFYGGGLNQKPNQKLNKIHIKKHVVVY